MAFLYGFVAQQLATVAALLLFCLTCWFYWTHRKVLQAARKLPPLLLALPVVGHGYFILRGFDWMINFLIKLVKDTLTSGAYNKGVFWVGPYPFFLIADPEEVHTLLSSTKSFEGGIENQFLGFALGNGLITAPVHVWKVTRRHVNALFHPRNLEQLLPMLNECARDLVSSLTKHAGSGLVDVEPLVYPIALKSTCKLLFGPEAEVNMESDKFMNLLTAITRMSQLAAERFVKIYVWPNPMFKLLYRNEIKQIEEGCDGFIVEAIEACRKQRRSQNTSIQQHTDDVLNMSMDDKELHSEGRTTDGLTQMTLDDTYKALQENYPTFTEKDLHYEMRTILLGGSESTRATLSSCLLALAANPHVQEKLYSEIVSVTGSQESDVTPEDIRAMSYLDQVLKETLRKFIIIPMVTRRVQEDLKLKDWTIPEGALVGVPTFGVHFNPKYYPDPERFDPDRFSPENVAARGRYSYIPFSSGPRNCIGKNYSMLVLKTLLVHVLKRFTFYTTVDIDSLTVTGGVVMGLKGGYKVEIEARKKRPPTWESGGVQESQSTITVLNVRRREDRFID